LKEDLRPRTTLQHVLFPQIANLLWRLERLPQAQADIFTEELPKAAKRGGETLSPAQILARRFSDDRNNGFILLDRYERTMRNALLRLLKQFDQLAKRPQSDDPDDRVPREGDRPAWTMEKQKHQEEQFALRAEESEQFIPPRNEYQAKIDAALWRQKQTQTNPIETVDSTSPKPKCPTLQPPPATKQTHSPSDGKWQMENGKC
jgi:hypothetical protein